MSTDPHPDDHEPTGEISGNAGGSGGQDGWQAPDAGAFAGASSYPVEGSKPPGYGNYQTPPAGRPGPSSDYPAGAADGRAGHDSDGQSGYVPGAGYGAGYSTGYGAYGAGYGPGYAPYTGAPGASGQPAYGGYASLLAPKPSIIPLRPLSIGEILGGAFESLRANPKAMFVPSLVVMAVIGAISAVGSAFFFSDLPGLTSATSTSGELSDADLENMGASLVGLFVQTGITTIVTIFAASILVGLLIVTVSRTILGRKASLGDVWQRTRPRVGALIGQAVVIQLTLGALLAVIIFSIAFIGGFTLGAAGALSSNSGSSESSAGFIILTILAVFIALLLVVLGIFALSCKLSLAPAALILENIGVFEGISRSWRLTRGYFWRVVGIRLLSTIIVTVASWMVSGAIRLVTQGLAVVAPNTIVAAMAASVFVSSLIQAVTMPFDSAVVALIYTDLRMRSEGLDVELRRAAGV